MRDLIGLPANILRGFSEGLHLLTFNNLPCHCLLCAKFHFIFNNKLDSNCFVRIYFVVSIVFEWNKRRKKRWKEFGWPWKFVEIEKTCTAKLAWLSLCFPAGFKFVVSRSNYRIPNWGNSSIQSYIERSRVHFDSLHHYDRRKQTEVITVASTGNYEIRFSSMFQWFGQVARNQIEEWRLIVKIGIELEYAF